CESISELLWITRENARPSEETAAAGGFQIVFERDRPVQLLRITVPGASRLFPEVSGSHHRCTLRFLRWNSVHSRPVQASEDIPFTLAICY
ncbi:MAG TPA: cell division protein ZapD, partial [Steroidobacteraceae bacterium]|nr:cell division protein ZapD [Steroidobacteraceae bacterium]